MKNIFITILLLFVFFINNNAQTNKLVENITWDLTETKMTIYFDLLSPDGIDRTYDLEVKIDLGDQIVEPTKGITGKIGQRNGKQRKIIWYYPASGKTIRELEIPGLNVMINPKNPNPPISNSTASKPNRNSNPNPTPKIQKPKLPSLALPAAVTAVGVGVGVYGLILEGDAKSMYDEYVADKVDSAARDQKYKDADDKHIQAQIFGYVGGAVAIGGVYLLTRTMKKRKAIKNKHLSIIPSNGYSPYLGNNIGMGIQYYF